MNKLLKKRVAVLRGGPSSEHDFSISSGKNVLDNLDREIFDPVDIYIDKVGIWHLDGAKASPFQALQFIDVVFNAMHGEYGEDGTVQKVLDDIGIGHNGSKNLESKISIDKKVTSQLLKKNGILMPRSDVVRPSVKNIDTKIAQIWKEMQHPLIVKPVASGSSIGIVLCRDFTTYAKAVKNICSSGHSAMVEQYIVGREVSVAVIEDMRKEALYAAIPVTIKHNKDYFDNTTKKSSQYHFEPMKGFSDIERKLVMRLAKHVHHELGLRHYSVSDFIISDKGIYFLEVNSLPGLSKNSILPVALTESGIAMKDFLTHVIERSYE